MGEIFRGVLGGFSGGVGTVVGSRFRTMEIIKIKPRRSNKPPVQSQVDQRFKFGMVTSFLGIITDFVNEGFTPGSVFLSPMNAAVKYNLSAAITGTSPNFTLDYSKIVISNGKMNGIVDTKMVAVAGSKVLLTWNAVDEGLFKPDEKLVRDTDSARVALYNVKENHFMTTGFSALRGDGTYQTRVPSIAAGSTIHVWIFFVSQNGKLISKSQYLGSILSIV